MFEYVQAAPRPASRLPAHAGRSVRSVSREEVGSGGREQGYCPPGWPAQLPPPGVPDWQQAATDFLLDCCPPDYRGYPVLRRHPVVLARLAADHIGGQARATREALGSVRMNLREFVPDEVLDAAADVLLTEEARLARLIRQIGLVEEALRGGAFIRKL